EFAALSEFLLTREARREDEHEVKRRTHREAMAASLARRRDLARTRRRRYERAGDSSTSEQSGSVSRIGSPVRHSSARPRSPSFPAPCPPTSPSCSRGIRPGALRSRSGDSRVAAAGSIRIATLYRHVPVAAGPPHARDASPAKCPRFATLLGGGVPGDLECQRGSLRLRSLRREGCRACGPARI